jgi:aminotransferase EvaB
MTRSGYRASGRASAGSRKPLATGIGPKSMTSWQAAPQTRQATISGISFKSKPPESTILRTWAYDDEYDAEREEILAAVDRVFRSGQLILGPSVAAFESEFAESIKVRHGVGVANGTDGLFLVLKALNIGAGDEVITVPNTAIPTVAAIVATGARPVFVDVVEGTWLMDVSRLDAAITPRTRCVIPVHLYGQCAEMERVLEIATARGVHVVEDSTQAHGARRRGVPAGSSGIASVFSFYPTKPLGAYGDGGLIATSDDALAARLRRLRFYGIVETYCAEENGYNSRLDEVQAEILRAKLPRLAGYVARRRGVAARYDELLAGAHPRLPASAAGNHHVFHQYVVTHPQRGRILQALRGDGIELSVHYPVPVHLMPAYRELGHKEGSFPMAERAAKEVFSLPMYPSLREGDQLRVVAALLGAGFAE